LLQLYCNTAVCLRLLRFLRRAVELLFRHLRVMLERHRLQFRQPGRHDTEGEFFRQFGFRNPSSNDIIDLRGRLAGASIWNRPLRSTAPSSDEGKRRQLSGEG
jgi:hypothetical protein